MLGFEGVDDFEPLSFRTVVSVTLRKSFHRMAATIAEAPSGKGTPPQACKHKCSGVSGTLHRNVAQTEPMHQDGVSGISPPPGLTPSAL